MIGGTLMELYEIARARGTLRRAAFFVAASTRAMGSALIPLRTARDDMQKIGANRQYG